MLQWGSHNGKGDLSHFNVTIVIFHLNGGFAMLDPSCFISLSRDLFGYYTMRYTLFNHASI